MGAGRPPFYVKAMNWPFKARDTDKVNSVTHYQWINKTRYELRISCNDTFPVSQTSQETVSAAVYSDGSRPVSDQNPNFKRMGLRLYYFTKDTPLALFAQDIVSKDVRSSEAIFQCGKKNVSSLCGLGVTMPDHLHFRHWSHTQFFSPPRIFSRRPE